MPRRSRRLRDMARRRMRDMRNPYGSRGGYVVSDRRDYAGRRMDRDYGMDMGYEMDYASRYGNREYDSTYDYPHYSESDYARGRRDYEPNREYDRHYDYPYMMGDYARTGRNRERDYARGRGRDYGRGSYYGFYDGDYLEDEDLMEWSKELMKEVEEKDKAFFSKENMQRKAEEMGIKFDKFSFPEFYTTTLMMYTDYHTTLGTGNMEVYLKLAKDWLCDEDAELQYGEKLSAYYESIVEGE